MRTLFRDLLRGFGQTRTFRFLENRFLHSLPGYSLWLFLHLILWVIRPFKYVKFVWIQGAGIGHLAYNTDIFLRRVSSRDSEGKGVFYFGVPSHPVANQQLLAMYARKFYIAHGKLIAGLLSPLTFTRSSSLFENLYQLNDTNCPYYTFNTDTPLLSFTDHEEDAGRALLREMGVDDQSEFVCFHARDSAYLSSFLPKLDARYHGYRDCNVMNYLEAAKYVASYGGYAIRMGHVVAHKLPDLGEPRIIDYASRYRSDFGDIYLSAKAKFFLGNTAGIFLIARSFGVPLASANYIPLELLTCFKKGDLFIPKKIWAIEKRRFLTFREILESGIGYYQQTERYERAGLEVVENSAEEILDLTREMNEVLEGTFRYTEEDEELQSRFHGLFRPQHRCYGTPVRLGAKFLGENRELLQ